jgi:hypothetical protein
MNLLTESDLTQVSRWPKAGRYILAQFDENSISSLPSLSSSHRSQRTPNLSGNNAKISKKVWQTC